MKIALISQREQVDKYGVPIDVMESVYIRFFESMGICTVPVSNFMARPQEMFEMENVIAVVLTGGGSLPTKYYDEDYGYEVQSNRDFTEKTLLQEAILRHVPVIGICRGMQFINGYFGGKVSNLQGLQASRAMGKDHTANLYGEEISVNNYHNDGIYEKNLAINLDIICKDVENKVVEAYYCKEKKILGIQWHPERKFSDAVAAEKTAILVKKFIESGGSL